MTAISARALQLFDELVELPPAERERRLAQWADTDPDLHAALRALLDADAQPDAGVLDRSPARILAERHARAEPAPAPPCADLRVGARLGAWRIDRLIGRGGMGAVYEAHRDDGQYQQRIALKCVRAELDSPRLIAAMREERNLLARLDHPGIAALVDGGVDGDGRPWFALRYVEGEPIDAWCDRRRLGVTARVDLLLQVCDAVAYAHAQGVLHRDLKPSNVLVAADGRAQLLDFGISAQLGPLREAQGDLPALTPQYAAPEARLHGAQGPATDLYALGVLTYRLLSGQWPTPLHGLRPLLHGADSGDALAMAQLLEDADDAPAHLRGAADAQALARRLHGDLSAIALKAVAARAQDRYASVAEFADELRRWREGRPVRARPGTWLSRSRKWLRRNPLAAGLSAALFVVAAAAAGGAWWQHRQAAREAEAGGQVGRLFASTVGTATLSGLGSARFSSRALLERTERELRALPLADQPALRAHALATLADGFAQIGDYTHGARLADEAHRLSGDAGDRDEDGFVFGTQMAMLNYQGRHREALAMGQARLGRLDEEGPAFEPARIAIGAELARTQWALGDTAAALARADDLVRRAQALGPGQAAIAARALILRSGFRRDLGRLARAEDDAQRALALAGPIDRRLADNALEGLVDVQRMRLSPDFAGNAQRLLDERRRGLGADHPETGAAEVFVALSQFPLVSRESALATLDKIEAGYGRGHPVYALALSRLAWTAARDGDEELRMQREAVATLARARPHSAMLFNARSNLAKVLMGRRTPAAPPGFDEGVRVHQQNIVERERAGMPAFADRLSLGLILSERGRDAQLPIADAALDAALRAAPSYYSPGDLELLDLSLHQGIVRYRQGRRADADRIFARILADVAAAPPLAGLPRYRLDLFGIQALLYRATYALETCRFADAAEFLQRAQRTRETMTEVDRKARGEEIATLERALRVRRLPASPPFVRPAGVRGDAKDTPIVCPAGAAAHAAAAPAGRRA
ncbi:serine/threonine protein kinase [Lysobacter sp. K5869]|uniref:serine/threonine-protein kinase n=1 Tax=Lysobacter sp. K5869 TaxID=2820808 RepID=UPI001C063FB6|nr:serine/threonine-protein kinase [Lysobacter sp. K5869]QWP74829.1 serine/threonine protein kinase [Lysobacter sp. K5869]